MVVDISALKDARNVPEWAAASSSLYQLNPSSLRGKRSRAEQDEGLLLGESRSSCKRLEQQAGPAADTSQDHAASAVGSWA